MDEPGGSAGGRAALRRALALAGLLSLAACGGDSPALPDPQATEGYLFVSDDTSLDGFAIDAVTGALSPLRGSPLTFPPTFRTPLATDAGQRFVIVGETSNGTRARVYAVDRGTASFKEVPGSPFPLGLDVVRRLGFAADLGIAAASGSRTARPLRFDAATGAISAFGPVSGLQSRLFSDFALHPSGRWAFDVEGSRINTYSIESDGQLRLVSTFQGGTLDEMRSIAVTASGRWMVAAGAGQEFVHLFRVDAAGVLDQADRMSPGGEDRPSIAVDPLERFVFVATDDGATPVLASLRMDATAGRLLLGDRARIQVSEGQVAVTPSGRFVYHVTFATAAVSGFRVDPATGSMTPVPGSPYTAAGGSAILAIR